eukprot:Rmarinus@m.23836
MLTSKTDKPTRSGVAQRISSKIRSYDRKHNSSVPAASEGNPPTANVPSPPTASLNPDDGGRLERRGGTGGAAGSGGEGNHSVTRNLEESVVMFMSEVSSGKLLSDVPHVIIMLEKTLGSLQKVNRAMDASMTPFEAARQHERTSSKVDDTKGGEGDDEESPSKKHAKHVSSELRTELLAKDGRLRRMQQDIKLLTAERSVQHQRIIELTNQVQELEDSLRTKEGQLRELSTVRSRVSELDNRLRGKSEKIHDQENLIIVLQGNVRAREEDLERMRKLKSMDTETEERLVDREQRVHFLATKNKYLKEKIKVVQANLLSKNAEFESLQRRVSQVKSRMLKYKRLYRSLNKASKQCASDSEDTDTAAEHSKKPDAKDSHGTRHLLHTQPGTKAKSKTRPTPPPANTRITPRAQSCSTARRTVASAGGSTKARPGSLKPGSDRVLSARGGRPSSARQAVDPASEGENAINDQAYYYYYAAVGGRHPSNIAAPEIYQTSRQIVPDSNASKKWASGAGEITKSPPRRRPLSARVPGRSAMAGSESTRVSVSILQEQLRGCRIELAAHDMQLESVMAELENFERMRHAVLRNLQLEASIIELHWPGFSKRVEALLIRALTGDLTPQWDIDELEAQRQHTPSLPSAGDSVSMSGSMTTVSREDPLVKKSVAERVVGGTGGASVASGADVRERVERLFLQIRLLLDPESQKGVPRSNRPQTVVHVP